jgi:hypothetical protein
MNSGDLDKDKPSFLPATWAALPTLSAEDMRRLFIAYNLEGVHDDAATQLSILTAFLTGGVRV